MASQDENTSPPAAVAEPVAEGQRNRLLDALRGVALLGILLMNIPFFAMPDYFSEAFRSDPANVNFWVGAVVMIGFEGKMRALFGMIFGAGVVLFVAKKERTGRPVTGLFYRRMFWLVVFGLIHAHLILWMGDILYLYGICGMFVYLFRNVNPKYLVLGVPLVAVLSFTANTLFYQYMRNARIDYVEAKRAEEAGAAMTDAQKKALDRWRKEFEQSLIPSREVAAENTRKMKSGYAEVASHVRPLAFEFETTFLPIGMWDSVALMLLGIALYKWGFLTGAWSNRAYWRTLLIGYGLGLPLVIASAYHSFLHYPNLEVMLARIEAVPIQWMGLIYPFQRILLMLAHVSVLVLLYKGGYFKLLFRCLEAVGQTAFTNYILQSVICTLTFYGYGLNYYAEWEYYQLYIFVLGVWTVQLIVSPLWLRYFLFGPLEWLWRSLTYWKLQPFRRRQRRAGWPHIVIGIIIAAILGVLIEFGQRTRHCIDRIEISFTAASPDAPGRLKDLLMQHRGVSGVAFHGIVESGKLGMRIVHAKSFFERSVVRYLLKYCEAAGFVAPKIVDYDYRI